MILLDYKLELIKEKRKVLKKFRIANYFLYNLNYNKDIESLQSNYDWHTLNINEKIKLIKFGYNRNIWDSYQSPIKNGLPKIIDLYKYKINKYYLSLLIIKCQSKKQRYDKRFLWIKMKALHDQNRLAKTLDIHNILNIPNDILVLIIKKI